GPALVRLLGENRHVAKLGAVGDAVRQRVAQLRGLRPHARAARKRKRAGANENARDRAGVLCGLAAGVRQRFQTHQIAAMMTMRRITPAVSPPAGRRSIPPARYATSASVMAATRVFAVAASRPIDCSSPATSARVTKLSTAARSASRWRSGAAAA